MRLAIFFVAAVVLGVPVAGFAATAAAASPDRLGKLWVYVGTYTKGTASQGIYLLQLDRARGELTSLGLAAEAVNPSFVAIHPHRHWLYAVGEGKKEGGVGAYRIEPRTGKLTLLGRQSSGGIGPCHVLVDLSGKCVLAANYGSGGVACLPIEDDGRLRAATSIIQHRGSSINPQRQTGPHAHSSALDPANRLAFVCDLGLDKIMVYRLDAARGLLTPNDPPFASVAPGSGPRHFAFHPNAHFAYVINEMASTVTAFEYDAAGGRLSAIQTITTLPADFHGSNTCAEIQVHPSGKFLYGSNRGHDSIAMFAIDGLTGKLSPLGFESTQGKTPRNFGLDPSGAFLLAANMASDNVVLFRIGADGKLTPTGQSVSVPAPVCVKMMPPLE
jgi:6-phosphogluconolactonase